MSERLTAEARGVYVISATPFLENGEVDYRSFDTLIEFYIRHRVHGMTILGMMGEAHKLADEESLGIVRHVLRQVAKRVPVVVGVSAGGISKIVALANESMAAGASGVMVAPPPGINGDEGVYGYFKSAFKALGDGIPVVLQDFPQATGVHLSVPVFNRLVDEFPQLVMLKHEDCPGLPKLSRIRAEAESDKRRRVSILVGNGGLYYPQEMRRGADGAMTGFAYPEMLVGVYEHFSEGNDQLAEDLFDIYLPLARIEQQPRVGLAFRKEILRRRGAIAHATQRAPAALLTPDDHRDIDGLVSRLERSLESFSGKSN